MLDTIPGPLKDRMEVIRLSGYDLPEKVSKNSKRVYHIDGDSFLVLSRRVHDMVPAAIFFRGRYAKDRGVSMVRTYSCLRRHLDGATPLETATSL